jgi:hypothetical protein
MVRRGAIAIDRGTGLRLVLEHHQAHAKSPLHHNHTQFRARGRALAHPGSSSRRQATPPAPTRHATDPAPDRAAPGPTAADPRAAASDAVRRHSYGVDPMSAGISRNDPCPCGSGRKFKRCCQEQLDHPAVLPERHIAVGSRIQDWAHEHHDQQIHASLDELADGRQDLVLGDADLQLISSWVICDRELPDGQTIAHRYSRRADITADERDIAARIAAARFALLTVDRVAPGRSLTVNHLAGDETVTVASHDVSRSVTPGDVIVARIMDGPPAPTLWGPVAFLDHQSGPLLQQLLTAQIRSVNLPHDDPASLAIAMHAASREITVLLSPGLRPTPQNRLAA